MGFFSDLAEGFSDVFLGGAERKAAKAQREAAREGQQLLAEQFQQTASGLQPFIGAGIEGLGLQRGLFEELSQRPRLTPQEIQAQQMDLDRQFVEGFQESPATQFLRERGTAGLEGRLAATGGLGSGQRLRELTRLSQGLATQDFARQQQRADALRLQQQAQQERDFMNRLGIASGMTGTGLSAATGLGGFGAQQAQNQANLLNLQGQLRGQELAAGPGAFRNLLGQGLGIAALGGAFGPQGVLGGLFRTGTPAAGAVAGGGAGGLTPAMMLA